MDVTSSNIRSWVFTSLLVLACGPSDQGKRGSTENVAKQQSGLTASSTLSQALSGRVNPVPNVAPGGRIAAAITGEVDVEHNGSASYRFPIWVPDGMRGMQPELSVEYNSHRGFGVLGPKWNVGGLSAITRCGQKLSQDGVQRPVNMEGDNYCLDGQRLVRISGTPGNGGEFRTELNPFRKIVALQTSLSGIEGFEVWDPDGRISYYGTKPSTRLNINQPGKTLYYAYYLEKVLDRYFNSMLVTYRRDFEFTAGSGWAQELVPDRITWGATEDTVGKRSVSFVYQPGSLSAALKSQHSVGGSQIFGGHRLAELRISGPDATNTSVLLKKYKFGYLAPTITGETLLTSIDECDASDVCKRGTMIDWEQGSWTFTRKETWLSDPYLFESDFPFAAQDPGTGYVANLPNVYRRIVPVDLDNDGRDDIVYRNFRDSEPFPSRKKHCLTWFSRKSLSSGSNVSFGAPSILPEPYHSDPECDGDSTKYPYPGDPIFADLNLDGYTDIFLPHGNNGSRAGMPVPLAVSMERYVHLMPQCLTSGGVPGCLSYVNFLQLPTTSPQIAAGDVTGDGMPEVLRPSGGSLLWTSVNGATGSIARVGFRSYQLLDLDADGTMEVVQDTGSEGQARVSSPTINATLPIATSDVSSPPNRVRWMLDLNGDGLLDIVEVKAATPGRLFTYMNLGNGSFHPYSGIMDLPPSGIIGQSWRDGFEPGVRIMDLNLDGRQDLILVDNGATPGGESLRTNARALISDGTGNVSVMGLSIPVGDPADGTQAVLYNWPNNPFPPKITPYSRGYRTTVVLDVNGDGLKDIAQMEGGFLVVYVRDGKKPDMVTKIREGTGRQIEISYAPASDSTVYTNDPNACFNNRLTCLTRDRWLPKQISVTGWHAPGATLTETTRYTYTGGLFDRFGRGFLGFKRRDIYAANSRHTTITYSPSVSQGAPGTSAYTYPLAFRPNTVTVDLETLHGKNTHYREVTTTSYTTTAFAVGSNLQVTSLPTSVTHITSDCLPNGIGGCHGGARALTWREETRAFDKYGNVTSHTVTNKDTKGAVLQTERRVVTFKPANEQIWLVRVLDETRVTSTSNTVSPPEEVTRVTKFTPEPPSSGQPLWSTGEVRTMEIEPNGTSATRRLVTIMRDPRGRVTSLEEKEVATGLTRPTTYQYQDADGVYATTTTNALGHPTRVWRHPGFGFVVETDDPNGLASVTSYDTFGRKLSEIETSGASTTYGYADASDPIAAGGVNMTISPEGKVTRQIRVHLDSFGRETIVTSPVDASRGVAQHTFYDAFGRVHQKIVKTGPIAAPATVTNTHVYTYDDLDRLVSDCHLVADGTNQCETREYAGRATTITNESGRRIINTVDGLGRLALQRADLATGTSDATFTYGAFGLLRSQSVLGGNDRTSLTYDVLGRQTSLTRTGAATRSQAYNAFGDITSTWKQDETSPQNDLVIYGRDALGRLTTIDGMGATRTLRWDTQSNGIPAPFGKGKLIEMSNGTQSRVTYSYGDNGLVRSTTWALSLFQQPMRDFGMSFHFYDSEGRLEWLHYPQNLSGSYVGLRLKYTYDPYVGSVASIADAVALSNPLWAATARNDLGLVTTETMKSYAFQTTVTKTNSYYPATGQLNTSTLSGAAGQSAGIAYTYQRDGLPGSLAMSGVGGSFTQTFDYDNLKRLTRWGSGGVDVTYGYDSDGHLTSRSWSSATGNETVSYATTPNVLSGYVRTVSTNGTSGAPWTDNYQVDAWGRVFETPSANLVYNAVDEVVSITEKANGNQADAILRSALGERLATTYGTSPSGSYMLTLMDDLYEFRYSSATNTFEERCRLKADDKIVADVVRTASNAFKTATFYLTDNIGSVVAEASNTAAVTARARRDPFGNLAGAAGTPFLPREPVGSNPDGSSRFGYAGHSRDNHWGLIDMNARFYSPRLGRFLSPDRAIADASDRNDFNPFAYVRNRPTALNDPTGNNPNGCGGVQCGEGDGGGKSSQQSSSSQSQSDMNGANMAGGMNISISGGSAEAEGGSWQDPRTGEGVTVVRAHRGSPTPIGQMNTHGGGPNPEQQGQMEAAAQADAMNGLSVHATDKHGGGHDKVTEVLHDAGNGGKVLSFWELLLEGLGKVAKDMDATTAAKNIKHGGHAIGTGGGVLDIMVGIGEFWHGSVTGNAVEKTKGAFGIGAGLGGLIIGAGVGGPVGALFGLAIGWGVPALLEALD